MPRADLKRWGAVLFARLGLALLLGAVGATTASAEKRVALVIGNASYQNAPALASPTQDAQAIADVLKGLGFEVVTGLNQTMADTRGTIAKFAKEVQGADIALFYYAGHGLQVGGRNYIVPVDAALEDDTSLDFETLPVNFVLRQMLRQTGVRLVFLDACRDDPLADSFAKATGLQANSGLAEMKIAGNDASTLITLAAAPGQICSDGGGDHSPFSAALIAHLDEANVPIAETVKRVADDVSRTTGGQQTPTTSSSLAGDVVLKKQDAAPAPLIVGQSPPADNGSQGAATTPPGSGDQAALDAILAKIPKLPSDAPVFFDIPINFGDPAIDGHSIAQLIQGKPHFGPIEGLDKSVWDRECSGCHQWTKQLLCDQAKTYMANPAMIMRLQHPLGFRFKAALLGWAKNDCQ